MATLTEIALSQYGTKEIEGDKDNMTIVNYAKEAGHTWVDDDETPWCSVFIDWCAMRGHYERSKRANARSWVNIGQEVKEPATGDVVVFKRGSDPKAGHVAIFVRYDGDYVYVLGGNQSDSVNVAKYRRKDIIAIRRLRKA